MQLTAVASCRCLLARCERLACNHHHDPHRPGSSGEIYFTTAGPDSVLQADYAVVKISIHPVVGVPIALEVRNEGRAERTIGLVARIGRAIAPEQIKRLLADAQRAAIADRANRAGIAEAFDHVRKRSVDLVGPGNLV